MYSALEFVLLQKVNKKVQVFFTYSSHPRYVTINYYRKSSTIKSPYFRGKPVQILAE